MLAFLFPGQGSQTPGMGKKLFEAYPAARQLFEEADDTLGFSLSKLCFEGSEDELKKTEITQPAILTTSIATLLALRAERPDLTPDFVAGHSLGEWSALVAAGAISFKDAVTLVQTRGQLMQAAVPNGEGAMAAIIGLPPEAVGDICNQAATETGKTVAPANYNSPEQTVVSGAKKAVDEAVAQSQAGGAKKAVLLPVSAPFHCTLMQPAADGLKTALDPIEVRSLSCPLVSNVKAVAHQDPALVKELLVAQVTACVRWTESIQHLAKAGVVRALELGPGKVLMGLSRRIDRKLKVTPVSDPDTLKKALETL